MDCVHGNTCHQDSVLSVLVTGERPTKPHQQNIILIFAVEQQLIAAHLQVR